MEERARRPRSPVRTGRAPHVLANGVEVWFVDSAHALANQHDGVPPVLGPLSTPAPYIRHSCSERAKKRRRRSEARSTPTAVSAQHQRADELTGLLVCPDANTLTVPSLLAELGEWRERVEADNAVPAPVVPDVAPPPLLLDGEDTGHKARGGNTTRAADHVRDVNQLHNHPISNLHRPCNAIEVGGHTILLPPACGFFLGDVRHLPVLRHTPEAVGVECVVVDPPFPSKSVERSGAYQTLALDSIGAIDIQPFISAQRGAHVLVWVTNDNAVHAFVRNVLFPKWQAQFVGAWVWVKVTDHGELVVPLSNRQRRPYEMVLCGTVQPQCDQSPSPLPSLPPELVLVGVPGQHSRKPCLKDIVGQYLSHPRARVLELFARNLTENWFSVGNEVLKFQHSAYHRVGA